MKTQETESWLARDVTDAVGKNMAAQLAVAHGIKPPGPVVNKVLRLLRGREYAVAAVARAFEGDPSLAANLLRLANSALFGATSPTNTVEQAVVRLGARQTEELLLASMAAGLFSDPTGTGAFYRDHCAGTAALARTLSASTGEEVQDGMFLCGLMHDVGKLVLLQGGYAFYKRSLDATPMREPDRLHLEEQAVLGFDHALLGGYLLLSWKIPEPTPSIVAFHHRPADAMKVASIGPRVALLRLADQLDTVVATRDRTGFEAQAEKIAGRKEFQPLGMDASTLFGRFDALCAARDEVIGIIRGLS